ncbi:MAG: GNAT family N-acetyltransferase [Pseudomonadota bacterium]
MTAGSIRLKHWLFLRVVREMVEIVTVRAIAERDFARWQTLWAGYLSFYDIALDPEITATTWQRLLGSEPGTHDGFAAVSADDEMVGFAHSLLHRSTWTTTWYAYLEDLFVDPAFRGGGVGHALIEAVIEDAKRHDAARVFLITDHDNATARRLYDRAMTFAPFVQYRVQIKERGAL